ncbi:ActS/PrrB/RegB family redox-sensitive histidine kinase [Candidatus Pelagibacter sp.]|nr:ActS/PrrB/RegB family redox-sensitive histidine kinase [Candidatus Pelagibacter sp.]MDB9731494.1 ActS/PrrB/RegB family redox-sensitive histidine kinase [Candidatus Pelagibacter sp.]MDC1050113.1 ActS/PrrB/RegB family redox-sensitive histidine kinase [Candidatus Pelagibacter sp.]
MKFFETSKYFSLKKSTYINLRWIAIVGQLITINLIYFVFGFKFNLILENSIILIGVISNLYLIHINKNTQLLDKTAFLFLFIDILQLSCLIYLTGGIINPFSIFLIIPAIFSTSNLGFRSNLLLVSFTVLMIIFLTFFNEPLPYPVSEHFHVDSYYYYSIPIALIIALIFLNYFALTFGSESRIRKEALNKMEEIMSKEHELLSLGGQAAAAAHSLGTPFSTIKIISTDLLEQFKDNEDVKKDIELLSSQIERCSQILKKLTLNPVIEDDFIDRDLTIADYMDEIVKSYKQTSKREFIVNYDQNSNPLNITKSIEIVYGLRNFIGNANKFSANKIFINIKSDNDLTEVIIEDDGEGYPKDVLNKIGEPYIKSVKSSIKSKSGLGLGIFIGKTLLEKNYANILCRNSKTRSGAEVSIKWKNKDLLKL